MIEGELRGGNVAGKGALGGGRVEEALGDGG